MSFSEYFPIYDKLSPADQSALSQVASIRSVPAGTLLHNGSNCYRAHKGHQHQGRSRKRALCKVGRILVIRSGQLRVYITSDEGKEITMYRLFERDICLFSASCVLNSIQFDLMITAEKDTQFWIIPPMFYKELVERNLPLANYTNQLMASRFTDVMWLMEQVMFKSFDKRLAHFLLEESALEGTLKLKITHEIIASHLGTAREVVTRMLKYFQTEGMVALTRGTIELLDEEKLALLSE